MNYEACVAICRAIWRGRRRTFTLRSVSSPEGKRGRFRARNSDVLDSRTRVRRSRACDARGSDLGLFLYHTLNTPALFTYPASRAHKVHRLTDIKERERERERMRKRNGENESGKERNTRHVKLLWPLMWCFADGKKTIHTYTHIHVWIKYKK